MVGEVEVFIKVWIAAISSLCFCYYIIARRIPGSIFRLLSLLPIIFLFIILPFNLSSLHLGAPTVFYLVWLANFKLLLFSFDHPPLSSKPPLSLLHFISITLLPIKVKQHPSLQTPPISKSSKHRSLQSPPNAKNSKDPPPKLTLKDRTNKNPSAVLDKSQNPYTKLALLATKVVLLAAIIVAYGYREYLNPYLIFVLYCCHVYLGTELILSITVVPVRILLGLELEPQFNEPYLATSLQDFWGRRWNLMVSGILRPTVYQPVRMRWGPVPAYMATFLVSGLMHEVIYFYLTRVAPTWEVTWFFVLHGVCTAAEVATKRTLSSGWRLHRMISGPLTLGFVAVTGYWLFFPQIIRNGVDLKAIHEYSILASFVKGLFR